MCDKSTGAGAGDEGQRGSDGRYGRWVDSVGQSRRQTGSGM